MTSTRRLLFLTVLWTVPAMAHSQAATVQPPPSDDWFHEPCTGETVDHWGWTRFDLHGIRIRIPPDVRHVKYPNRDELHFRYHRATMQMRLHNDASRLFARHYTPQNTRKHCWADLSGGLAEVISLGGGGWFGFAARWPDADRGEWLAVVISGTDLAQVTYLRRTLFTITFPGARGGPAR